MKSKPVPRMKTIARRLLDLFGVDGKHWIDGDYDDGEGNYCLIGGIEKEGLAHCRHVLDKALREFDPEYEEKDGVENWNDSHQWKDIKKFLMKYAHPYQPKIARK